MRLGALGQDRPGNCGCRRGGCDGLEDASARELVHLHVGKIIAGRSVIPITRFIHLRRIKSHPDVCRDLCGYAASTFAKRLFLLTMPEFDGAWEVARAPC